MVSHPSTESPLSGGARFALVCGAGLTILLSYLFSILAIVFLLALLGVELLLLLVLLRFGLSGVMARVMERHVGLIGIFFRSFRLRKGAAFQLSLQPSEAPGLFAILAKLCSQLNVALPREVALQMGVNAWVQLKGYRRGAGKTVLGIGFDLLAGLSAAEVESVLAHEMVHAKLIQRGFRSWLNGGLGRLASLSGALSAQVHAYRSAKLTFDLAEFFLRITDSLTRLAARLVATYSRQDEFDADRGAAELCGAATVRSMLVKLDPLHEKTSRLPWNQRVAQLQLPEGFSKWLVKELVMEPCLQSDESVEVFDKYSTHPLIRDRLAALPVVTGTGVETVSRPAIELLAEPDAVAAKLIAEIQRVLAEEEQKDSKELRRWARKRSSDIRPVSLLGFFMVLGALIGGGFAFFGETSLPGMGLSLVIVIAGVFVFRLGKYKDRVELPVPDFGLLKAWRAETIKDFEALQKQIETELRERITKEKKKRKKVLLLSSESYEALGRCDYLRAHVAARLCQEIDNKSVEAFLSIAVASAALKMSEQSVWALHQAQKFTGLKTRSTRWGAAWTLFLNGEWGRAEAFLDEAVKQRPDHPTLLALLSEAQSQRGKSQSALQSARRACAPGLQSKESTKLLINLLLDGGHWREAKEWLLPLEPQACDDTELLLPLVQLNLMQHNQENADKWTAALNAKSSQPETQVQLGHAYEAARQNEKAAGFYERALATAYFPEACLGLGRIQVEARNKAAARQHFLAALNVDRPLGDKAVGPVVLFHQSLRELLMLNEPMLNCRAWVASFGDRASIKVLANQSLMIYALSEQEAEEHLRVLISAMQPGVPPPLPGTIRWREAHHDQQPARAVRSGIQFVFV